MGRQVGWLVGGEGEGGGIRGEGDERLTWLPSVPSRACSVCASGEEGQTGGSGARDGGAAGVGGAGFVGLVGVGCRVVGGLCSFLRAWSPDWES